MRNKMKRAKWIPKVGEKFWALDFGRSKILIEKFLRLNDPYGNNNICFNMYKTKREVIAAKKKIVKVLGGK